MNSPFKFNELNGRCLIDNLLIDKYEPNDLTFNVKLYDEFISIGIT